MRKVKLANGFELAYDDYNFAPPWADVEPVVLVHGFTKNRKFWFDWIPALARHYRVIRVDLPGHGDSNALPTDFTLNIRAFSDTLAEFLDALQIPSAHFVMAEFTSAIALDFAVAHPQRIRKLVLPGLVFNTSASSVNWDEWAAMAETKGSEAWARATNHTRLPADAAPEHKEWYVTQQGRFPGKVLAGCFRAFKQIDLSANLPLISQPTLVMTGELAVQQSADGVRNAAAKMQNATVKIFNGMPLNIMSACPDLVIAETLKFLGPSEPGQRTAAA